MKKILKALATTFGLFGLAVFAIFFAETNTGANGVPATVSLTADIAANIDPTTAAPVDAPPAPAADPGISAPAAIPTTSGSTTIDGEFSATPIPTAETTASTAPTSTPSLETAPAVVIAPLSPEAPLDTTTIATATITVTPTAPPGPSSDLPTPPKNSATAGSSLPYDESHFAGDQNWQTTWGVMQVTSASFMDFSAGPNSIGGSLFLKSSEAWENYKFAATLDWMSGTTIGLMGNYSDVNNYVLCQYSKTDGGALTMQLMQYVNGGRILLSPTSTVAYDGGASDADLSIEVNGTDGTCSFNGQTVSNSGIGPQKAAMKFPGSGGIGFIVADALPNASEMIIKRVSVTGE